MELDSQPNGEIIVEIGKDKPLRVAIVGAGPAGFYLSAHLLKREEVNLEIDLFERLLTPTGLIRYGVAPDHQKDKSVGSTYGRYGTDPRLCFYGGLEYGTDIDMKLLKRHYHQIAFTTGLGSNAPLGVPGEDLIGSHAATEFVGWYNSHPDFVDQQFDLSHSAAVVIGNGNVALDAVRMLGTDPETLDSTDISDYALKALANSKIEDIYLVGRRGPAQAAFTPKELKELLLLTEIRPEFRGAELDPISAQWLEQYPKREATRNLDLIRRCINKEDVKLRILSGKRLHFKFWTSPVAFNGDQQNRLTSVTLRKNTPNNVDGQIVAEPTDETETIATSLVISSVGYRGQVLADLPIDQRNNTLPHKLGRITDQGKVLTGLYTAGWVKRGASGVIGTNKTCAKMTAESMLKDFKSKRFLSPEQPSTELTQKMLMDVYPCYINYEDWRIIDSAEVRKGRARYRPRVKFFRNDDIMSLLRH